LTLVVFKILFLLMAVLYTFNTILRVSMKNDVPAAQVIMATIGIVGFTVVQFNLY